MKILHIALEKRERVQRKYHAETIGGVRRILLKNMNAPRRKAAFDEQRKQKAGRTGANDMDSHGKLTTKVTKSTKLSNPFIRTPSCPSCAPW